MNINGEYTLQEIMNKIEEDCYDIEFKGTLSENAYKDWFSKWFKELPTTRKLASITPFARISDIEWEIHFDYGYVLGRYKAETGSQTKGAVVDTVLKFKEDEDKIKIKRRVT